MLTDGTICIERMLTDGTTRIEHMLTDGTIYNLSCNYIIIDVTHNVHPSCSFVLTFNQILKYINIWSSSLNVDQQTHMVHIDKYILYSCVIALHYHEFGKRAILMCVLVETEGHR